MVEFHGPFWALAKGRVASNCKKDLQLSRRDEEK